MGPNQTKPVSALNGKTLHQLTTAHFTAKLVMFAWVSVLVTRSFKFPLLILFTSYYNMSQKMQMLYSTDMEFSYNIDICCLNDLR